MQWSDIPRDPPTRTLREFATLWILFFGGLALWRFLGRQDAWNAAALATLALSVGPLGLAKPALIRPIFVGWLIAAFPIGWLISKVILLLLFFAVFTPIALIFRLVGRDALHRRGRAKVDTYWSAKVTPSDFRRYLRQY